jgi:hypothetical protein
MMATIFLPFSSTVTRPLVAPALVGVGDHDGVLVPVTEPGLLAIGHFGRSAAFSPPWRFQIHLHGEVGADDAVVAFEVSGVMHGTEFLLRDGPMANSLTWAEKMAVELYYWSGYPWALIQPLGGAPQLDDRWCRRRC